MIVGELTHVSSGVSDFYRELGYVFNIALEPRNRWGSFKALREKWHAHVESTYMRPLVLIDE